MSRRIISAILVSLALAAAIHTDWHFARPATHHLSLGLSWHWLLGAPVFALVAWYVAQAWPSQVLRASIWIVGGAVLLAGVLEPAWEFLVDDATFGWAFGPTRTLALATFVATGLVAYVAVLACVRRGRAVVRRLASSGLCAALLITAPIHSQTKPPAFAAVGSLASPRIATLRQALAKEDRAAVEQFWSDVRASSAPLVEPSPGEAHSSLVTFVYRGNEHTRNVVVVDGVAVAVGGVDPKNSEMIQLAGSDVWYRTYKVRNDARFVYKISENDSLQSFVDPNRKSDSKIDPLNPRVFPTGQSYVELPEAPSQDVGLVANDLRGTVNKTTFNSATLGNVRDVWVYTPHDFRDGGGPYSLIVVLDGSAYTSLVPVPTILDNLIGRRRILPAVAVMVGSPPGRRDAEQSCTTAFGDFLAKELVPWMRQRYSASGDPRLTVIGGSSRGGLASSCAAFRHPDVFGKVLSQSGSYWWTPGGDAGAEFLTGQFARTPKLPLQFFMEVGEMEVADQRETNRRLHDVLRSKGYVVDYREFNGNHTYLHWRGSFGDGLISLIGGEADRAR